MLRWMDTEASEEQRTDPAAMGSYPFCEYQSTIREEENAEHSGFLDFGAGHLGGLDFISVPHMSYAYFLPYFPVKVVSALSRTI